MTPFTRRTATVCTTAVLGLSLALAGAVSPALAVTSESTTDVVAPTAAPTAAPSVELTTEAVEAIAGATAESAAATVAPSAEPTAEAATPSVTPSAEATAETVETFPEAAEFNAGSDKYELAAAFSGNSVGELKQLEKSGAIEISENGFVLHIDDAKTSGSSSAERRAAEVLEGAIPGDAAAGSRPGAPVTVYLDFDGEVLEGTNWNAENDEETLTFEPAASANAAFRERVWAVVAEDYAPFNVNVTTTRPSDEALYKTAADDNTYGSHVIVTDSYTDVLPQAANSSGVAWGGGAGSEFLSGAFVFTEGLGGAQATSKTVGDTASHESGHNFGLMHDGIEGSTTGEYYYPTEGVWAPIMGASFEVPVTQWSNGGYAGATELEDDLSVITDRSAVSAIFTGATTPDGQPYTGPVCPVGDADPNNPQPGDQFIVPNAQNQCDPAGTQLTLIFSYTDRADFAADQVGNTPAEATTLENTTGTFSIAGVIETTADVDVYAIVAAEGPFTATVDVADISPNLDTKLTLVDSEGTVIDESAPVTTRASDTTAAGLNATVTAPGGVDTGAFYLIVDGVGEGDPTTATPENANGYTDYGSLGNYTLSGAAVEFVAEEIVIETPTEGTEVVGGSDVAVTGTATPGVTVTLTFGGQSVTTTADDQGDWEATITANAYGNTEIVATQSVDGLDLAGSDSVTVTAPVDAPVISSPAAGTTTADVTPTISGTGIAGATVTVTVTDASGNATTGQALVTDAGTWELILGNEFAAGAYTVAAVQTINGVTSAVTGPIAFSVLPAAPTGNENPGDDGTLAATGSDFAGAPFALMAAGLLMGGVFMTAFALRRRNKLSLQS
ncbi:Ig-like domain-containing protein [Microbacterium sp. P07]|uniref:Ig-like domain-containing protein n=1 Tax=Microbacterium sp. P07 TaxID=3366952 RepID=UPI003746E085